jgi:hypothetical protein
MPAAVGTDQPAGETPEQFLDRWRVLVAAFRGESPLVDDLDALDFSGALLAVKAGHHITRDGWNGNGLYVTRQAGYPDGIDINQNTADATGLPAGTSCVFPPYLMLCSPNGTAGDPRPQLVNWVPSIGDVMAVDWRIVARP